MKANGNEPTIRLQLDKALDLRTLTSPPQSSSTKGTLTFDFDENAKTDSDDKRRSMSLKLAAAKEEDKDISLKGNLFVLGSKGGSGTIETENKAANYAQFKAELDGGVTGDIILKASTTSNITLGRTQTNQNIEIGGGIDINGAYYVESLKKNYVYALKHDIKLNGQKNIIKGEIKTSGYNGISFTDITIGQAGSDLASVEGGITAGRGILNLSLNGDTNTIKTKTSVNHGTLNINLNGTTNSIEGNVSSETKSNYSNALGILNINFRGNTNKITGNVWAGNNGKSNIVFEGRTSSIIGHILAENKNGNGNGTNNITFKSETNKIQGNIFASRSSTNNITFTGKDNSIIGDIHSDHYEDHSGGNGHQNKGTNNITFNTLGGTSHIKGKIYTGDSTHQTGANTKIELLGNNSTLTIDGEIITTNGETKLSLQASNSKLQLTQAIKANGGTTHLTISGSNSTLTAQKLETSNGGKLDVSFTGNNSTLRLRDAQHQISTLKSDKGVNKLIDLSSSSSASSFTLLEIGTKNGASRSAQVAASGDQAQTSAFSGNYNFKVYVDPNKKDGKLGDNNSNGTYGSVYSDRVVIHSKANTTQSLLVVINPDDLDKVKYEEGKGTEGAHNIALATIKKESNANADFIAKEVINGGERIQVKLKKVETDEYGKVSDATDSVVFAASTTASSSSNPSSSSSTTPTTTPSTVSSSPKTYYTYFLDSAQSLGADTATQQAVSSALVINYDLYIANFNSINKRMGELRESKESIGLWGRVFGGAQKSNFGLGSSTEYITTQFGMDKVLELNQNSTVFIGLAFAYSHSQSKVNSVKRAGAVVGGSDYVSLDNVRSNGYELGLYVSYLSNIGWYNDTIAKVGYIDSKFGFDQSTELSKVGNLTTTLSNETGYRFVFGEKQDYYLDPQLELAFGYILGSDFSAKLKTSAGSDNLLKATHPDILMLRSKLGASIGKKIFGDHRSASLYLGAFYEFDYVQSQNNRINLGGRTTTTLPSLGSSGRVILNLGSNININDNTRMYVDVEKSFGDKLRTHLQFNLGARYAF